MSVSKILVVDDLATNLELLETDLEDVEAEIIKAISGRKALEATYRNDISLAIVDVQMPQMDGYQLVELLRSDPKTRHIPIIFLSAVYSDEYHIFKGYLAGGVDFLTKPYNLEILIGKINFFLALDQQKKFLENAKKIAEEANVAKSEFMVNLSQELSTNLHDILSLAKSGINNIDRAGKSQLLRYFQEIYCSAESQIYAVNDWQTLSSMESGKVDYNFVTCSLSDQVRKVIEEFNESAQKKQVKIIFQNPEFSDFLHIDKARIAQVVRNLLSNAIKSSPLKNCVNLEILGQKDKIMLTVTDKGKGIPEGESMLYPGKAGLWLSLSKKIIADHNGELWAQNNPEGGSTFKFSLPKYKLS